MILKKWLKKNKNNFNELSESLKKNLKLRKDQVSKRDNMEIIGKRTNKIGQSRLIQTYNKK